MDSDLRDWIRDETGQEVVAFERSFTGGSRELWIVDLDGDGDSRRAVLRVESGGLSGTPLSLDREARVYHALVGSRVPMPVLLASRPDAMLIEWIDGTSNPALLTSGGTAAGFMTALAELHAIDPSSLDLPGFAVPGDPAEHALIDLDLWSDLASDDPMIAYALGWLQAHAPEAVQRTVLVHGDAGPGNFIYREGDGVVLVDWEFAHLGDPMDDIAWCDLRSREAPAFESWQVRDALYEAASGLAVDAAAVAYYAVFVRLRCAVTTAITIAWGGGALGLAGYQRAHAGFLVGLGAALGAVIGVVPESLDVPDVAPTPRSAMFARAVNQIGDEVLPNLADRAARLAARDTVAVVEHLNRADRYGAELQARDVAERPPDLFTTSGEAGRSADADWLAYLQRRAARLGLLWGVADPVPPPDRSADV